MNLLDIPYKESFILKDDLNIQSTKQRLSLIKFFCSSDIRDRYYLQIYSKENQEMQGYLYFYLDQATRQSKFIGVNAFEKYRNCGIASFLIASWIQLCLDEGFINLETISKQRKPFIIYILKKYFFDHGDISEYQAFTKTVYICAKEGESSKCISFANKQEESRFRNSNVMKMDNYEIVDYEQNDIQVLDSVVLYTPYVLQEPEKAYQRSLQIYNKYK